MSRIEEMALQETRKLCVTSLVNTKPDIILHASPLHKKWQSVETYYKINPFAERVALHENVAYPRNTSRENVTFEVNDVWTPRTQLFVSHCANTLQRLVVRT